jgi:hypothetical protein
MTIAERQHIDTNAALSFSALSIEPTTTNAQLQLELADTNDLPQHDGSDVSIPNLQSATDMPADITNLLVLPSGFPIGSPSKSPLDLYCNAHQSWFVRLIFLLVVAVLHTRHHVTYHTCSLLLFMLSLIFVHLSLTPPENQIPVMLNTVLLKLNLQDQFTINPVCNICQWIFKPNMPHGSQCPDCQNNLFIVSLSILFQCITGKSLPLPPPRLLVPIQTLFSLLTEAFTHGPLEDQIQEWMDYTLTPGHYTGFMDSCVAQELKDHSSNLFFHPASLIEDKIHLGVTWSIDWYIH